MFYIRKAIMTFPALRNYIQEKKLHEPHSLLDCNLIIDADSYFKDSYKHSGCQFISGPECNRYASYLQNKLACFVACNITCFVIFQGTTRDNTNNSQTHHEKIVNSLKNIDNLTYFEPLFVKDVQKEVLNMMGIKYFCCEYESMDAIVGVARTFKCPVLTYIVEYCVFGVSCVTPTSLSWEKSGGKIQCMIYKHELYKPSFGVYNKMPLLLTVLSVINELPEFVLNRNIIDVLRWVKRQNKNGIEQIANYFSKDSKRQKILELFQRFNILYSYPTYNLAVKYFQRDHLYGLFKDDKKWFSKGVSNGRIGVQYVSVKHNRFLTGSTIVNDVNKPDAMQAAAEIIAYIHCLLTNSQLSTLKYIGRKNTGVTTWDVDICFKTPISNREIFTKYGRLKKKPSLGNPFKLFVEEVLSEEVVNDLHSVNPSSCRILFVTLLYYVHKINKQFRDGAYFIFLCYLILRPVRNVLNLRSNSETVKDCQRMFERLKFLFEKIDVNHKYDVSILHSLSEFQHCLLHMNNLRNLCGQIDSIDVPCTLYHNTYNATFVYNAYKFMRNKNKLMEYLETNFKDLWPLKLYKDIISAFEKHLENINKLKLI